MVKVAETPEIIGALTSGFTDEALKAFAENQTDFRATIGVRSDVEIKVVENTNDTMNITLPFYSCIVKDAGQSVSDEDLDSVSGGWSAYYGIMTNKDRSLADRVSVARSVMLGSTSEKQRGEAYKLLLESGSMKNVWLSGGSDGKILYL